MLLCIVSPSISPNMNIKIFRTGEVASASSELGEYKRVQEYCSNRLDSLLDDLQNTICDLCEEQTDHEDKLMVSLAGLKQVCFVDLILRVSTFASNTSQKLARSY